MTVTDDKSAFGNSETECYKHMSTAVYDALAMVELSSTAGDDVLSALFTVGGTGDAAAGDVNAVCTTSLHTTENGTSDDSFSFFKFTRNNNTGNFVSWLT